MGSPSSYTLESPLSDVSLAVCINMPVAILCGSDYKAPIVLKGLICMQKRVWLGIITHALADFCAL